MKAGKVTTARDLQVQYGAELADEFKVRFYNQPLEAIIIAAAFFLTHHQLEAPAETEFLRLTHLRWKHDATGQRILTNEISPMGETQEGA